MHAVFVPAAFILFRSSIFLCRDRKSAANSSKSSNLSSKLVTKTINVVYYAIHDICNDIKRLVGIYKVTLFLRNRNYDYRKIVDVILESSVISFSYL